MNSIIRELIRKKMNVGGELLIPRDRWAKEKELHGNDELIINHPIIKEAFEKILEIYSPEKKIAFVSLCSSTRPYSAGRRWKNFVKLFSNDCDLFISSNGGFIPIKYEMQYPFLSYDARGTHEFDNLYINTQIERFNKFFSIHRYRFVMFQFRPNLRNSRSALISGEYLKKENLIEDFSILPDEEIYSRAQKEKDFWIGYRMFPELHPVILKPIINKIKEWSSL